MKLSRPQMNVLRLAAHPDNLGRTWCAKSTAHKLKEFGLGEIRDTYIGWRFDINAAGRRIVGDRAVAHRREL